MKTSKIVQFIESNKRNEWIASASLNIYVRRSVRLINKRRVICLDIASVAVKEPKRRSGVLTAWLAEAQVAALAAGIEAIYIENCLSEDSVGFCEKHEFKVVPTIDTSLTPCYYKLLTEVTP
jgi:N-acetylglutamate synthase-like GNAT family acetyltransferase